MRRKSISPDGVLPPEGEVVRVGRKRLINSLNRVNFNDGRIMLNFRHRKESASLSVPAKPCACLGEELTCEWHEGSEITWDRDTYEFENFYISDGLNKILVEADLVDINEAGASFILPPSSYRVGHRGVRRHRGRGVSARVTVSRKTLDGELFCCSALSFSVKIPTAPDARNIPLTAGSPARVLLSRGDDTLFSDTCEVLRKTVGRKGMTIVFRPLASRILKETPQKYRSLRPGISPLPNVVFTHPLTGRKMSLKTLDISGSGFSVAEHAQHAALFPGLTIPEVQIEFTAGFTIDCQAQVVYCDRPDEERVKSGFAITDIGMHDHTRLTSLLHQEKYRYSTICPSNIELDDLWDFFFESGFIYPEKYAHITDKKEHFKRLYRELYTGNPQIARHIIYRDMGIIYGHISMYRFYPQTWILHHHAALNSSRHRAGFAVMEQLMQYVNELHLVFPEIMRYACCYFRPDNRYASRVFTVGARSIGDPEKCSLDDFAYFHVVQGGGVLPAGWNLEQVTTGDLRELSRFYGSVSGGLMLDGMDLFTGHETRERIISKEYRDLGFVRERLLFALRRGERLHAVIAANMSDLGLNMSDLTNCLQVFVVNRENLAGNTLLRALGMLAENYGRGPVPALLYPRETASELGMPYRKTYRLSVLDLEHVHGSLDFIEGLKAPREKRNC